MPKMTAKNWIERLQRFPLHEIPTPTGRVAWCEAGGGPAVTHVLLHGIGSSSANWLAQLEAASDNPDCRVLAWDAPGYGSSDALAAPAPGAADYALRMWDWLEAVAAQPAPTHPPITLVGHSLGCLVAASAAQQMPERIRQLILLSPAQGYGRAPATEREKKLQDRLDLIARLGPAGMAQLRAAAMLGPNADADQVAQVQHAMAQVHPHGYAQAARMLAGGDLQADLVRFAAHAARSPRALQAGSVAPAPQRIIIIASGSADTITPPSGCQHAAAHIHAPYLSLGAVGHACAIEAAGDVTRLIGRAGPASTPTASNFPASTLPASKLLMPAVPESKEAS